MCDELVGLVVEDTMMARPIGILADDKDWGEQNALSVCWSLDRVDADEQGVARVFNS